MLCRIRVESTELLRHSFLTMLSPYYNVLQATFLGNWYEWVDIAARLACADVPLPVPVMLEDVGAVLDRDTLGLWEEEVH